MERLAISDALSRELSPQRTAQVEAASQSSTPLLPGGLEDVFLCSCCETMFHVLSGTPDVAEPHYQRISDLYRGIELRCSTCLLIWSGMPEKHRSCLNEQHHNDVIFFSQTHHNWGGSSKDNVYSALRVVVQIFIEVPFIDVLRFDFALELAKDLRELSSYSISMCDSAISALELAHSWYTRCFKHHNKCHQVFNDLWMPTRLVDIGMTDSSLWRLIETAEEGFQRRDYFSLSHCWGKVPLVNLNSSTIESMKMGLPVASLPPTFRDTIQIARSFGAKYLWIDSLCIVQDSHADWERESAQMRNVYARSALNIAASDAVDSTVGCLYERGERLQNQLWRMKAGRSANSEDVVILDLSGLANQVGRTPLSHRAWVVQERILSSRTLHMARSQLFWECAEGLACENWPDAIPKAFDDAIGLIFRGIDARLQSLNHAAHSPGDGAEAIAGLEIQRLEEVYRLWEEVTQHYTACHLTKPHDKLAAISGLAKVFQESLPGDTYLAGLWKNDLARGMLWRCRDVTTSTLTPIAGRAPSWSWAGVDGSVKSMGRRSSKRNDVILVDIIDAQCTLLTPNNTGQVTGGFVSLNGMLFEANFQADGPIRPHGTFKPTSVTPAAENVFGFLYTDSELRGIFSDRSFFCLPVREVVKGGRQHLMEGLMLAPLDSSRTKFVRIGLWKVVYLHFHSRVFGIVIDPFGKRGRLGQKDSSVQEQTITII